MKIKTSELEALAAKHPDADWEDVCNAQGWNRDSQILHLEGFVRNMGLMPAFAAYAKVAADEENAEAEGFT